MDATDRKAPFARDSLCENPASEMPLRDNWAEQPLPCSFTYKRCSFFYQLWGNPELPPVVLLHGFMQSSTSWNSIASSFTNRFCVYALDFIGHGLTEKSKKAARYTYEDMAASVDYFLRKVVCAQEKRGCEKRGREKGVHTRQALTNHSQTKHTQTKRAHVIGYSMGGRIALRLLQTSSDVLASVVLESCNLGCATETERTEAAQRNQGWVDRIQHDGMEAFVNYWETLPMFATQKELGWDKLLHVSRAANNPTSMVLCLQGSGKQAMPLTEVMLEAVRTQRQMGFPMLYIYGDKDAKSAAVAATLEAEGVLVSAIPAGHNVHLEAPMLYLKEVVHFLANTEAGVSGAEA
ncbi:MAG: alpha/beta fold hydrolase [Eggerthellaceae bacterium]|nr:alpha/beta fold hydrolase [Eggerthellaceae bacterium]